MITKEKIVRSKQIRYSYSRYQDSSNLFNLFLYDPTSGKDYVFNDLTAIVWELLDTPKASFEVVDYIIDANISTDLEAVTSDIDRVISILLKNNLVVYE